VIVAVAATAKVAIPTLQWLQGSEHTLLRVITTPDSNSGRGKVLTPSPVADWAKSHGVELIKPNTDEQMQQAFQGADVVIAIAYGRILKKEVLEIPLHGFLNLHFSLLPAYRGAAPVQRAILHGETVSGITIFQIDESLDTGAIFLQESYQIPTTANSDQVLDELSVMGPAAFEKVLRMISDSVPATAQNSHGESYASKISKDEAHIDWNQESVKILNSIRAYTSSPGAWTSFRGSSMKVTSAEVSEFPEVLLPGELRISEKKLFIGTKDVPMQILKVVASGKQEMSAKDWINGARLNAGDVFE
jgi:methionyl-tRNA formyltransferase